MKIARPGKPDIIIGKRITLSAALLGIANGLAAAYPSRAQEILAYVTPVIFIVQMIAVNVYGITTHEDS